MFRNGRRHWLAPAALSTLLVFFTPAFLFATNPTLANGTDPANASLAPGGAATFADSFTLQTTSGADTVTNVTVTLAAGTFGGLSLVEITNDTGTTVYGSVANPASNTPAIALTTTITATTTATQYKIRVTPKTAAAMPAPPGSIYNVTAFISSWTGTGTHTGSDSGGTTVTIDNLSPGDVTATGATAGASDILLSWTNPADADLGSIIVLRRATNPVANTPAEGAAYSPGNTLGTSTIACVITPPTATCDDTGLVVGTTYNYKIYTRDTSGNYSAGIIPNATPLAPRKTTILADGVDPGSATIGPGTAAINADSFTFTTNNSTDSIFSVTVTLAAGTSAALSLVEITNNGGGIVYGSVANPTSDILDISLLPNISATTTISQYRIRLTPKSHAAMPAPPGSTYLVKAILSDWVSANLKGGNDSSGTTITIDNLSPGDVTASTATAGNAQVVLNWTNPTDIDFGSVVVLRRAGSAVADTPAEGATYVVGNVIGSSTVACVLGTSPTTCTDSGLTNGTAYYYEIFAKDNRGNYATGAIPAGSPATPNVTTLANGADPVNASIAPGGPATMADAFTFQDVSGTDSITSVTVTLAAGTFAGLNLVEITNDTGTVVYGSVTDPVSNTPTIPLTTNIIGTATATQYKIRLTPKTHANMPVPPGSSYSVTALISNWTGSNVHAGSDSAGTTVTIDNLSPGNVTASTATAGNAQVSLTWTNPVVADLGSIVVLRRATSAVADTPTEGAVYVVGNTIGASTVACVVTAPTAACTDSGLTNATAYHYKIFAKDTNGNYAIGVVPAGSPATPNATTLASGTDPANANLAPGGAATLADAFTLQTAIGTDTITAVNVALAVGTSGGLSLVEITNDAGTVVYGSVANPATDTPAIALTTNITATTTATQYKIRVTPKTHANMPVPPGSSYSVTALISNWTGTNGKTGSDSGGTTVTIDNLSPGNVTASTATAGNTQATLAWINPADADLGTIIVLRRAGSAVASTPVEGTTYIVGTAIGTSTVVCVVAAPTATCTDTGLTNGTAYHYKIYAKDTNDNYATGVVPTGSPATPNVTTLANGVDPANANLAPGGVATMADSFTVQTATSTDTITAVSVTLAAGTSAGLSLLEITNNAGTTVYGSVANPVTDTPAIALTTGIPVTTVATQYKIRVTPKSHVNMPVPPGSTYSVTVLISNWIGSNAHAGSDSGGNTVTIDNLSPGNVTSSTATPGNAKVSLAWTNPADADLGTIIVLRRAILPIGDTPVEGATYVAGNTIGASTVACVVVAPTAACTDSGLTDGTAYHYRIFAKDTNGNYATGVIPTGSPATPFAGVTVTPTAGLVTTEAGGTATFTMVLTSQPTANVSISLTSSDLTEGTVAPASVTFTSVNWNVAQTVTVTGVDDAVADGPIAYTIITGAAVSTDPGYNGLAVPGVSVTNTDNDTAGVTVTPVSGLTTTEAGGTATFTMVLKSQPTADVTIPLSSSNLNEGTVAPASVTFTPANWNVAQTVTVTGVDDVFVDGTVAYTIVTGAATSADLVYSGMAVADVSVSNIDNDIAGVVVSPTSGLITTEAGGTATFTMELRSQPTANVTIPLSSSDLTEGTVSPASVTFTPANWNVLQTVTVTGVDDTIVDGTIAYTIVTGATSSTDPVYNGLAVADVSVSNLDNSTAGVTVSPTSGLVTTEAGGTATFTMVLTTQPAANVTIGLTSSNLTEGTVAPASVTFTTANWNLPKTVTVTGVDDFIVDGTVAYTIVTSAASSTDPVYNGLAVPDVSVSNTDNDTVGVTVSPTSGLVTTEAGGTATFTMVLTSQPTANVTIPLSSSTPTEGTVSPASVTFTAANWNIAQTVTVKGVDDAIVDGTVAYSIITGAASSSDPLYNGLAVADVSVSNTDNDTAGVIVSPTSGLVTTEAGGTATFTMVLTSSLIGDATILLGSGNPAEGTVSPASVTFNAGNWNVPQTITVTGVDDSVVDGNVAYTIVTSAVASADPAYSGLAVADVSVSNTDNDIAGVTVTPTSGLITTEAGGTATFTMVLTSQPIANVTIPLSSSKLTEGTVAPASVTFTAANWNVAQTVTVTGVDDAIADGTVAYSIVTGAAVSTDPVYSGRAVADVSVSNTDNDTASVTVTPTSGLITTEAGGTAVFTMVLTSQPTANVTIPLSSSKPTEGTVAPASITFTSANWNIVQTVTVTGVDDAVVDGTVAYTIVTGAASSTDPVYNNMAVVDVSVSNLDNDSAAVMVTPTSGLTTTEAGGTATFTMVLTSQPTATVTIPLSSSKPTEGTVAPASVTFTAANWNIAQTVTVSGVDDAVVDGTVAYTIVTGAAVSTDPVYSNMAVVDVSVSNLDNDSAGVTVTPTNGLITTESGGTATFTIVLRSQPTANVTIALSSSNLTEGTVSPASVTFTSANWNAAQTATITGVDDLVVDGTVAYTIVTGDAVSTDPVYSGMVVADVSVSNADNDSASVVVTPTSGLVTTEAGGTATFTMVLTSQPTANVTIPLTSSNPNEGTASPASVTFTPANWNIAQTVTVTGVDDAVVDGTVAYTIMTGVAISLDPVYNSMNVADVSVSNTDNDTAGVTVSPTSGLVTTEAGGTAAFTVVLTSQPTAAVTIPLSSSKPTEGTVSPALLIFTTVNWNIAQTVTVTGVDDAIVDGTVAYTIITGAASSTDPIYNGRAVADVSVSNSDNDSAGVTVTPTSGLITTEAGGSATFTMVLTSQPAANVTIPLSSSKVTEGAVAPASVTFTPANWNIAQTVTVTGVDDAVVDGTVAYTIVTGATSSTDPVYNNLTVADVSVSNLDNDTAGVTVTPTSGLTTTESGGTATFTMVLTSQPTANVTIPLSSSKVTEGTVAPASVTFTPANWNIAQTATVTGVDDTIVDGTVAYTIVTGAATSTDPVYNNMAVVDVSVSNTDNDAAGVTVTPTTGLTTTESGGTATFTMVLTSQPTANVTIPLSSSKPTEGTVAPASVTFTTANWNIVQTVTITGVDDSIVDGTVAYTIVTGSTSSTDPGFNGLTVADVSVTNTDNDTPGVTVTPTSGLVTTEAGGTATFTMVLTSQPTANVTIPLSSSDLTEGTVAPASVTFTSANWNVVQTVTVTGVDDAVVDGNVAYTIVTGAAASTDPVYNNLAVADVSVSNTDNDIAGAAVVPIAGLITTEAGGTATFTVVLTSQPAANVTIPLISTNPAEGTVSPLSLTFTPANWNVVQTVTVTGVDDNVIDGDVAYQIVSGAVASTDAIYNNRALQSVSVTNKDDDNVKADLSVTKTNNVTTVTSSDVTHYIITVTNNGPASVTGAVLTDPAVAGLTKTSITCSGPVGCPASLSIAALEGAGIALGTLGNLETVSFDVAATITAAAGSVSNTASVAVPTGFLDPVASNNSATDTDSVDPKPDIFVQVTTSTSVIELGDTLSYAVRIENRSGPFLPAIIAIDKLPRGFRYLPGSALLSSDYGAPVPMADPIGSPGPVLTFPVPAQPAGDGAIVSFRVRVGPGALQGTGLNIVDATALNGTIHSNTAQNAVVISGGVFTPDACVIGKIFADENRNHVQDKKELGIPGVHLVFEDGTILVSDVEGKYSYCGLTPTTHVLKVDRTTLPAGAQLTVSSNRNAGDANSLFVDLKYGEVHRADFIEGSRDPKVLAEIIHRRNAGEVWVPSFQSDSRNSASFADRPTADKRGKSNLSITSMMPATPAPRPVSSSDMVVLGSSYITDGTDGGPLGISTAALGVIRLSADRAQAPADGNSVVNLTMQVFDREGRAAPTPLVATIEVTGGRLKLPESTTPQTGAEASNSESAGAGTKLRIENGVGIIQLLAPGESQNVHVRVSVDDVSTGAVSADGDLTFVPRMRPFVAVGIFEGMMAHSTSDASTDSALPAHEAFDSELQHFARKGDGYAGGRSAMFAKGTVMKNYLLTLSYDSDKAEHGVLFRDIQPEAFYPIYGDASLKVFDAQTSGKFYVRAERGRSYMLYGDFQTVQSPTVAQDLGLYRRTMTGFQQHLEKQKVVLNIFGSHDSLTQVIDEISGLGISGPYSVSNTSGVSGTEKVEIVTRDRNQPAVILSTVAMSRFTDYEFEPFNGRLLFRRPVPAVDELLNPVSIRVIYEVDRGGDKAWIGGADGHVKLGRFVQVGGSFVEDGTPGAPYRLGSLNGSVKLGASTTLVAEGAQTSGTVNTTTFNQSGLFNLANDHGDVDGTAGRIELRHESRRVGARLFAGASSSGFNNPASTLTGGRSELSGHANFTLTKSVRLVGEAIRSEDKLTDGHREGALLSLETRLTKALGLEFGVRRSKESVNPAQGTSVGTPLFGPAGSSGTGFGFSGGNPNIDPATGLPIVNPGFAPQLSAAPTPPQTPASLDVLTVRAKITLKLNDNLNLYGEGEQDVRDANKNAAAVGGQLHLTERTRLYLRHEFISSMGSPYGLSNRQSGHNTVFGISSTLLKNTDAFNEYRMRDSISGREAEAAIGLRNLWKVAEGVNVSTSVERLTTFAGVDHKATAATAGFEFTRSPLFKSTERVEWRRDDISESWVSTIGLARKISRDWSVLSKNYFQQTAPLTGPSQMQNRFWIGGAYRQTDTDHLNILTRYEFRFEDGLPQADGTVARREVHTVSTHADWHPVRTWNFSGQYAAKRVKDSTVEQDSPFLVHLVSGRIGHDVSKRIDLGLLGSSMWSPAEGGRQSALGAEVGYLVHDNMWVSVGYNFTGFSDRDLTSPNQTSRGVFVRFRLKFDEDLFGRGH
jgi:hypothetical protein